MSQGQERVKHTGVGDPPLPARLARPRTQLVDFRNTRFWITFIAALFVVVNILAFGVYAAAHPQESFWTQLWEYAESGTAKLIAASLIFPLLLFVVEGRFNVTETVRVNRVERARKAQDERREARLETIRETSRAWNELYALATRISSPDGDTDFADIRARLWNAPVVFEDLINRWSVRFPNLSDSSPLVNSYLLLVNTLIECAASAMYYVRQAEREEERSDVRGSIDLIASGMDDGVHHSILNVLNASLELMEIRESLGLEDLRMAESDSEVSVLEAKYEARISGGVETLRRHADLVRTHLAARSVLATVDGPEVREFRELFRELATAVRDDARPASVGDARYARLGALYRQIPREQRLHAWNVKYSREWLGDLADEMVFGDFIDELSDPELSPSS